MNITAVFLVLGGVVLGLLLLAGVLARQVYQLRREIRRLSGGKNSADAIPPGAPHQQRGMKLTVVVRNTKELARLHSRVGAGLLPFVPRLVNRRVYETIACELRENLAERGVEAEVEIREGAP